MARPRGEDWLEDEIAHLKKNKVDVLVSLLERNEIYDLKLELEEEFCFKKNICFINFPIPDRDIPRLNDNIDRLIGNLTKKINEGDSIVVHCRMGIGRSSIIATAVLLKYNMNVTEIIENISSIRGLKVPDTDEQIAWLKSRE